MDRDASLSALGRARVYMLLTRSLCHLPPERVVEEAVGAGVGLIQVREPDMDDGALLEWVRMVHRAAGAFSVPVIVNDRPDVALIAGVEGVHLGDRDLPPRAVRELLGPRLLIGLSTHSREQVAAAAAEPVDYIGIGPVFSTATKGYVGRGTDLLRAAAPVAAHPAFAIGGIDLQNVGAVRAAGCTRIAVSSVVCGAAEPGRVIRALTSALD